MEPIHERDVQYSPISSLNTLQTCVLDPNADKSTTFWIVYLHGGAWRDPSINATSFDALQSALLASDMKSCIYGLASINYRLSPYPSHNINPSQPSDPARNAKHPDHIIDILDAIRFLQQKYRFGNRYVLVGHSCGATLAFQVAMARSWDQRPGLSSIALPLAIAGVEGIYDIPALLQTYAQVPAYAEFTRNAFGDNPETWQIVSPTNGNFTESWPNGTRTVLIHSDGDQLLDMSQLWLMRKALLDGGWGRSNGRKLSVCMLPDLDHDEVWQQPEQLATVLTDMIRHLDRDSRQ